MMETIRVNMTPCEDIKTIHASQNDNEAREWEFELHNNGEVIDAGGITEQMVFKSYEGGTEQILPENGAVPVTAPFVGDIKYPDATRNDQEFLYRQSPTEEDGNAKIESLYGKTLVWNQLAEVALPSTSASGITMTNNYDGSFTLNGTATAQVDLRFDQPSSSMTNLKNYPSAKYLFVCDNISSSVQFIIMSYPDYVRMVTFTSSPFLSLLPVTGRDNCFMLLRVANGTTLNNVRIRPQFFNLTAIFGEGNEPSTVEEFTSLFPLPYYAYNQGTLLSFNGNGIKTVGFNQWDEEWEVGAYNSTSGDKTDSVRDRIRNKNPIRVSPSLTYYKNKGLQIYYYDADMNYLGWNSYTIPSIITQLPSNAYYINFNGLANTGATYNHDICINISDTERNGQYEPYTSSTLSLPISQYFPSGMKSAGNVYDELTESKAITRVGSVDLGSLNWTYQSSSGNMYVDNVVSNRKNNLGFNAICSKYQQVNEDTISGVASLIQDKSFAFQYSFNGRIIVRDTSYTDATVFKQAMADQNVKLYYELATPTETSFTTASLVTENAEIPLSNEDGTLIGKCTEQLSENPGFIDAKIKLTDSDGECYSNKIQLHIERSPQ